jgi:hypothetical protein
MLCGDAGICCDAVNYYDEMDATGQDTPHFANGTWMMATPSSTVYVFAKANEGLENLDVGLF